MVDPVRKLTKQFALWAERIQAMSSAFSDPLCEECVVFGFTEECMQGCYDLIEAVDRFHQGAQCRRDLVNDGVYKALGKAVAADWGGHQ